MIHKAQTYLRDVKRWWRLGDHRYGVWWRLGNGLAVLLLLISIAVPTLQQLTQSKRYQLSSEALQLVGTTNTKLAQQLTYDAATRTYQFNKAAVQAASANPLDKLKNQVGTAAGTAKDKSLYGLDVPQDMSKGVTYHDVNSQLSFAMVPQFKASVGQDVQGHLVYPLSAGNQAIYTLKNNGLKEDIVVPAGAASDSMTFSYKLQLPKSLEAKVIPGQGGAIGIYSADPALFGDISYGNSSDQAAVQKARNNGPKTNLVFGLPAPVIKTPAGSTVGNARFDLSGNTLSVIASGLSRQKTAVTIDPSVVVTSTSDFQTGGNNDGNIDFSASGQINRGGLTGGSLGTWATTNDPSAIYGANVGARSVAYNGYIYFVGGSTGDARTGVYYAAITSNGTLGTWALANVMTIGHAYGGTMAYNGYMYTFGGCTGTGCTTFTNTAEYAPINSDGTLGTWQTTSNMVSGRDSFGSAVYNGYVYVLGGYDGSSVYNDVQYTPINGNGTLGTWHTTTSFSTTRSGNQAVAYNGYLYVMGGYNAGSTYYNDVQYSRINSDGTIGSWIATTSFTTARAAAQATVYNGYLYVMGGSADVYSALSDTQYAPIYANGMIGTWQTSSILNAAVFSAATVAYNGYQYILQGQNSGSDYGTVQYAKIDPAGITNAWHYTHSSSDDGTTFVSGFTTQRTRAATVAYNGYLYVMGGQNNSGICQSSITYAPLGSNGTVGTWASTSSFITGRFMHGAVAYNGYMYILGGVTACGTTNADDVQFAAINTNGTLGAWHYTHNGTDDGTTYVAGVGTGTSLAGITTVNGYVYVLGGTTASGGSTASLYAPLGSNGTVGTWNSTTVLTKARSADVALASGGYMYVIGGYDTGSTYYNDVQYAPINTNGTLGAWHYTHNGTDDGTTYVAGFTTARSLLTAYIVNGYLYIAGGRSSTSSNLNDVQFAPLGSNGTVGTWSSGPSFINARNGLNSVVYNGYAYILGGYDGTNWYNDVQFAAVNNGGSGASGTWMTNSTDLSAPYSNCIGYNQIFAANGYLYTVGGFTVSAGCSTPMSSGGTAFSSVYYAPINNNGSVGGWTATSSMNTARYQFGLAVNNGFVYALGGADTSGNALASTEYSSISSTGGLGTWTTGSNLGTAVRQLSAASYNGRVYVLGGLNTSSTAQALVQYASFNTDGSIATWGTTTNFPTARSYFASFAYNGYLYVAGGSDASNAILSDTRYAAINSDGTISSGAWTATSSLAVGVRQPVGMAANGFAYVFGGYNGGVSYYGPAQIAQINANGSLSTYTPGTIYSSTPRNAASATIYNGTLYMVGGYSSTTGYLKDVQYTSLNATARIAHYTKLIDLGDITNVTSVTYNGTLSAGSGIMYKAASSNGVFGGSTTTASITSSGNCIGTTTNTRYIFLQITLDDSLGGSSGSSVFPDSAGSPADLTDITVNYNAIHPAPNIRLRGGQTLQSGSLSSFDSCGS